MSDNAWAAAVIIVIALVLHSCASCEKERIRGENERTMERMRLEHAEKEKKP